MTIETTGHSMEGLFAQLSLPSETNEVQQFIVTNGRLSTDILLADAPFWTSAQSVFLKEEILMDADWAAVIEQLNVAIHASYAEQAPQIVTKQI